jgi:hypothetical protein
MMEHLQSLERMSIAREEARNRFKDSVTTASKTNVVLEGSESESMRFPEAAGWMTKGASDPWFLFGPHLHLHLLLAEDSGDD